MKNKNKEMKNLYNFNNKNNLKNIEKINKQRMKERENRIKQKKQNLNNQFDEETETVIEMINNNNKKMRDKEQKKITDKQRKIIKRNRRIKKIIKLFILLLVIVGGIVFALVSPIFNIKEIQVKDNEQIPKETIKSLSQLQIDQNIFQFSCSKVEKDIETNPYVKNAKVERKIPDKVVINIEERKKDFNIEYLNGYAYINNQGYILELSEEKQNNLPTIQGITTVQEQIVEGLRINEDDLERLQVVIQIINICKNYELQDKITSIDVENKNNYIMYMENEKKEIQLGDNTNLSNKMLYVPAILEENKNKEGTIYLNGDINNNFKPRFREKV